jgi:GAF domain-containing protein
MNATSAITDALLPNEPCLLPTDLGHERQRLLAIEEYNILDTAAEEEFDELTALASYLCDAPVSLIALTTMHRNWFKSKVGTEVPELPRSISFCQYTILGEDVFEVPDTLQDDRFRQNPLVTDEPNIRFYAGAPLVNAQGYKVGTICVLDVEPKHLTQAQKQALQTLSRQTVARFELRLKKQQLEKENQQLQAANAKLDQMEYLVTHDLQEAVRELQAITARLEENILEKDFQGISANLTLLEERTAHVAASIQPC